MLLVAAREECGARGAAHGTVGVKISKLDTLASHLVDARRLDPAIVKTYIAATQIISQDDEDVGLAIRRTGMAAKKAVSVRTSSR